MGGYSCFGSELLPKSTLTRLYSIIVDRIAHPTDNSYTATLTSDKVRAKISEEAGELVSAKSKEDVTSEASDLLYFMTVLLARESITLQELFDELDKRHKEKI